MAFLDKKNEIVKIDCKDFKPYINNKEMCILSKRCANAGRKYIENYSAESNIWGCIGIKSESKRRIKSENR